MAKSFSSQVGSWARSSELRMQAVFQEAVQELGREANRAKGNGGLTPVDTSFLINSFAASINQKPKGQSKKPKDYQEKEFNFQPLALVINKAQIGDRIILGWTAEYAPYVEAKQLFARTAAMNWSQYVNKAVKKVEKTVK